MAKLIFPIGSTATAQGTAPVALTILYRHSLRSDEAGMVIVPERADVAKMTDQLEKSGYAVIRIVNDPVVEPIPLV